MKGLESNFNWECSIEIVCRPAERRSVNECKDFEVAYKLLSCLVFHFDSRRFRLPRSTGDDSAPASFELDPVPAYEKPRKFQKLIVKSLGFKR